MLNCAESRRLWARPRRLLRWQRGWFRGPEGETLPPAACSDSEPRGPPRPQARARRRSRFCQSPAPVAWGPRRLQPRVLPPHRCSAGAASSEVTAAAQAFSEARPSVGWRRARGASGSFSQLMSRRGGLMARPQLSNPSDSPEAPGTLTQASLKRGGAPRSASLVHASLWG